jgi:hypothetical protein
MTGIGDLDSVVDIVAKSARTRLCQKWDTTLIGKVGLPRRR